MDEEKIEALVSEFREFLIARTSDRTETSTIIYKKDTLTETLENKDPVWKRILIEDDGICTCRWKAQGKGIYLEQELRNSEGGKLTIDSFDFDETELEREGKNYITLVLLHIPRLAGVWKKWKEYGGSGMNSTDSPLPIPNDLTNLYSGEKIEPMTKFQSGEWVMCKVSIRLGRYIRYHFSKAWSTVIRECGQNLGINDESKFQKISPWGLRKKHRQNVILPMLITISKEGKNLKTNLPSWWKIFSPESTYGNDWARIRFSRLKTGKTFYGALQKRSGHNDARIGRKDSVYVSLINRVQGKKNRGSQTILVDVGFGALVKDKKKFDEMSKTKQENKSKNKKETKRKKGSWQKELNKLRRREKEGKKLTSKEKEKLNQLKNKKKKISDKKKREKKKK